MAAEDLGVFEAISAAPGGITFEELRAKLGVSQRGLDALFVSLVTNGWVVQDQTTMKLTCQPHGGMSEETRISLRMYKEVLARQYYHLPESVKSGSAAGLRKVFGEYDSLYAARSEIPEVSQAWDPWLKMMHPPEETEAMLKLVVDRSQSQPLAGRFRMLDWCGKLGNNSLHAVRLYPSLDATVLDAPSVASQAAAEIKAAGMAGQVDTLPADLKDPALELPAGRFDGVLMRQTINEWSPEELKRFLKLAHKALKAGGSIAIDMLSKRREGDYPMSAIQRGGVESYFLMVASDTEFHHVEDVSAWLRETGFEVIEFAPLSQDAATSEVYDSWKDHALVARKL